MESIVSDELKNIAKLIASGDMDAAAVSFVNNAFSRLVEGKSDFETYHDTYTGAVGEAIRLAEDNGYTYDDDEFFHKVSTGPRKPSVGGTNSINLELFREGKPTRRRLSFQVYGMDSGRYELNAYIS